MAESQRGAQPGDAAAQLVEAAGLAATDEEFRARWGRKMTSVDPVIPDWDADEPHPMPAEKLTAVLASLRSVLAVADPA